jgi:lauroyl/myristoyl acyltransferase
MLHFAMLWLLVRVLGKLPRRALYAGADFAAALAWHLSPRLQATTRDHMRHALADGSGEPVVALAHVDRAARGVVRNAARYYADLARAPRLTAVEAFDEIRDFEGVNHLFEAYDRGCGVILLSAHLGSPEYVFRAASYLGLEMIVLVEVLSPPRVHALMDQVRATPGVRFVPADRGGVRESLKVLRAGGIVAILGDRDIQGTGISVPFFGERTSLPAGPVQLALRTNAALVPTFVLREGAERYRVVFHAPLRLEHSGNRETDLTAGMRQVASALERGIAAATDQWFALHAVWSGGAGAGRPDVDAT